jgi:hypothetical protein
MIAHLIWKLGYPLWLRSSGRPKLALGWLLNTQRGSANRYRRRKS